MSFVSRTIDWAKGRWQKNKWLFIYEIFNYLYDYPFYGWMMATWGIEGGLIAAAGSLLQNTVMFWWYDRKGIDWASAQELRDLESHTDKTWYERLFVWFGKRKHTLWERILEPVVYVAFLSRIDPLLVALHFQREHFKGLRTRDWLNILTAVAVANFWWALQVGAVTYIIRLVWDTISHLF